MSQWYEAKSSEIDIYQEEKEVYVYVTYNDFGSVYVTLTFAQVKKIAEQIELIEKP